MSYLRSEYWENGNSLTEVNYFICDITGNEICENEGYYGNDKVQISEKGMEILIEDWIKRKSNGMLIPLFVKYLENRFTNKTKPNRYISKKIRNDVLKRYNHTCVKCGSTKNLEIDHIKPISKGGINEFNNLQVLCKNCNLKKSNK
jgi:predicted restriction endonuclease